jgi:cholesterol oxidase
MRRLSKSIADIKVRYDAVVVGSGYGGGVAASRLARAGRNVAVLERGREFAVGTFPDQPLEAKAEMQITSSRGHIGPENGLYDLRLGKDMHVFVGCGLGGTSLVNANVSLEPDARLWEDGRWPDELVADPDLKEGYARARRMLRPTPYPNAKPLAKLDALERSAAALGEPFTRPPINVTFETQVNHAGVEQKACTLCGDCCSGCNVGAKNTVQMTYLPDAANFGAEIFTETKIHYVRKEGTVWRIYFEIVGAERDRYGAALQSIVADDVVLAAGTLGSTEILLRSRDKGLKLSKQLGQRFSGNGDVMAFGYNNETRINGVGFGHPPPDDADPVGPCIAGLIDMRGKDRVDHGMVIQEGSIPSGLAPILPALFSSGAGLLGDDTDSGLRDALDETGRSARSLLFGAYEGAVNHTQTYLVMSHDDAGGRITLHDDTARVEWPGVADQPIFDKIDDTLARATAVHGGTYIQNPVQRTLFGNNLITVHPLGGCVIGRDRTTGVVNHACQVFDGSQEAGNGAVHTGLYVCDGSVVPGPIGVNPLLTITALSERAMIRMAKERGWSFDDAPNFRAPVMAASDEFDDTARPAGIMFTERMSGYISKEGLESFEAAGDAGKKANDEFSFTATILIEDVDAFITDAHHGGRMTGTAICPSLSPEPLTMSNGTFNLMRVDQHAVETRHFDYLMTLTDREGNSYHLTGQKDVRADSGSDIWKDTTRLKVTLRKGATAAGNVIARGLLTISLSDFARQLRTIKGMRGPNKLARLNAVAKFGKLFAGSLYSIYGGIFVPLDRHDELKARKKRDLRAPQPQLYPFKTADGKHLQLTRYEGGSKGPVIFSHGLGVSSKIFSIDTIDTNLVEFLAAAGFDCWLLDYRASTDLPYATESFSGDDVAMYDYQPAVDLVCKVTGRDSVQMVAHCFGSTTFLMAMMSGLSGVRSAVCSQIATDVLVPWWPQRLLAYLRLPDVLNLFGTDYVNARASIQDGMLGRTLDWFIRVLVPFQWEERTHNATSNRITALYGPLYEIDQLNDLTLRSGLPEMFGPANINAFRHLARIARKSRLVDEAGGDAYLPNVGRLAIPIRFIHGAENNCFYPLSTRLAYERLSKANGVDLYSRKVIPGYGHIDCIFGKSAAKDVYPHILDHLITTA